MLWSSLKSFARLHQGICLGFHKTPIISKTYKNWSKHKIDGTAKGSTDMLQRASLMSFTSSSLSGHLSFLGGPLVRPSHTWVFLSSTLTVKLKESRLGFSGFSSTSSSGKCSCWRMEDSYSEARTCANKSVALIPIAIIRSQ